MDGIDRQKMIVKGKIEFQEITNKSGIHYSNREECGEKGKGSKVK